MKPERLHRYVPDELSPEQRRLYDAITQGPRSKGPQLVPLMDAEGRLEGPFNAFLLSPDVGTALQEVGATIRYRTALSDRAREIAILEVSAHRRADFEWYAHERIGRAAGLSEDEITAIRRGKKIATLDPGETLVRRLVRMLLRERDLDRAAFDPHVIAKPQGPFFGIDAGAVPVLLVAVVDRGGTVEAMAAAEGIPFRALLTAPDLGFDYEGG